VQHRGTGQGSLQFCVLDCMDSQAVFCSFAGVLLVFFICSCQSYLLKIFSRIFEMFDQQTGLRPKLCEAPNQQMCSAMWTAIIWNSVEIVQDTPAWHVLMSTQLHELGSSELYIVLDRNLD
jgi:hypothetical protein